MKVRWLGTVGVVAALALAACGGGGGGEATTQTVVGTAELTFEPTTLQATADENFTFELDNQSAEGVPHNFVVVQPGTEDTIAAEVAPDLGEIEANGDTVLYASEFVDGGDSQEFTIDGGTLAAGTYSYICTYPGHVSGMRGTLTVQ